MLLCAATLGNTHKVTGGLMASSAGVNPVVIRRLAASLKKHGLLNILAGSGGASLARPAGEISLYDVYQAVETAEQNKLFNMHERPNPACPVGRGIDSLLGGHMRDAQKALEDSLKKITIADLSTHIKN